MRIASLVWKLLPCLHFSKSIKSSFYGNKGNNSSQYLLTMIRFPCVLMLMETGQWFQRRWHLKMRTDGRRTPDIGHRTPAARRTIDDGRRAVIIAPLSISLGELKTKTPTCLQKTVIIKTPLMVCFQDACTLNFTCTCIRKFFQYEYS